VNKAVELKTPVTTCLSRVTTFTPTQYVNAAAAPAATQLNE